jgi:hypothetical protein
MINQTPKRFIMALYGMNEKRVEFIDTILTSAYFHLCPAQNKLYNTKNKTRQNIKLL